jgi:glucan 1,3-beta-glucosidase
MSRRSSLWHTKQSNVDRTNAIIKRIRAMFENNVANVPVIAGLNE